MKFILIICSLIICVSCHLKQDQKISEPKTTTSTGSLIRDNKRIEYSIHASGNSDFLPDTLFFNLQGNKLMVTSNGKVYKPNDSLLFDIRAEFQIADLYLYPIDNDIVAVYVDDDGDAAGSFAKRISLSNDRIIWTTEVGAFNLGKPVIYNNYMYLSTIGFIGKLNLNTGKFDWKFENLYDEGKYNGFSEPGFYKNSLVAFAAKQPVAARIDTIVVDEKQGKIVRKD
jgi:hypothetical protein